MKYFHCVYFDLSCAGNGTLTGWDEPVKFFSSENDARRCLSELEEESEKVVKSECAQIEPNQVLYFPYYFFGIYMQFPKSKYSTEDEIRELGDLTNRTEDLDGYVIIEREVSYNLFDDKDKITGEPFVAVSKEKHRDTF